VKTAYDRLKTISLNSEAFEECCLEIYNMFLKAAVTEINHFNNTIHSNRITLFHVLNI
jgi:hypothetical protein